MSKIIVPNAVKRRPGYLYSINSDGDLIETKAALDAAPAAMPRPGHAAPLEGLTNTDDNEKIESLPALNSVSYSDIEIPTGIRTRVLRNLLLLLQQDISTVETIMKELKCSKRTAYDYAQTIKIFTNK